MLRNFNLGPRLTGAFSVLSFLIVLLGAFALSELGTIQKNVTDMSKTWLPAVEAAGNLNVLFVRYRVFVVRILLPSTPDIIARDKSFLSTLEASADKQQRDYEALITEPEERQIYGELKELRSTYVANVKRMIQFVDAGDIAKAKAILDTENFALAEQISKRLERLVAINHEGAMKSTIEADETYKHSRTMAIVCILLSLMATVALAVIITRSITRPIEEAVRATELVASGNLSNRIQSEGRDEPARLLAGISLMQDNLRRTIGEIAASSTQLASATEQLNNVANDSTKNLQRQNDEIQQAAAAVTEMSAAVEEVAKNASSTSEASNRSSDLARQGRERVLQTVAAIENMSHEVSKTSALVEGLAAQSNDIGQVLDVIRAVAEQTNLLALNAAIEAARAGEAGRGFAVVADEVRALAHRTQTSTQEIEQMISKIQEGSSSAVVSMRESATYTKNTLAIAQEAGKALDQISENSATISDRNLLIASASEEQAAVAREVDRNIINISDLSVHSAAGANQTSGSARELSQLAKSLNGLVKRFVI